MNTVLPHDVGRATMAVNGCLKGSIFSFNHRHHRYLYHFHHLLLLLPLSYTRQGRGGGARGDPKSARSRARHFVSIIAVIVEIALIATIAVIQSGSYSFVIVIQSTKTGSSVLFSIAIYMRV